MTRQPAVALAPRPAKLALRARRPGRYQRPPPLQRDFFFIRHFRGRGIRLRLQSPRLPRRSWSDGAVTAIGGNWRRFDGISGPIFSSAASGTIGAASCGRASAASCFTAPSSSVTVSMSGPEGSVSRDLRLEAWQRLSFRSVGIRFRLFRGVTFGPTIPGGQLDILACQRRCRCWRDCGAETLAGRGRASDDTRSTRQYQNVPMAIATMVTRLVTSNQIGTSGIIDMGNKGDAGDRPDHERSEHETNRGPSQPARARCPRHCRRVPKGQTRSTPERRQFQNRLRRSPNRVNPHPPHPTRARTVSNICCKMRRVISVHW